jgi:hypothetical protein
MRNRWQGVATALSILGIAGSASAQAKLPGDREFGLNEKELVQAVENVEALIASCMREQGFEYVATDYKTVRNGMAAIMSLPGLSEEEFIEQYGYGISTLYTGEAPQKADGYSPAKVGLGERNISIYRNLSPADQVSYNRALLGENIDATFAVGLDTEDFSRTGGCTRKAIEQVFKPEQLKEAYNNPLDVLIKNDPRMRAAYQKYGEAMRKAGFDYTDPEEVEADIRIRLDTITEGSTIPVEQLSPEQLAALKKLQEHERRVSVLNFELEEEVIEPIEEEIQEELFPREVR